jgi:glucose-1-phosphate adenylyltransferase
MIGFGKDYTPNEERPDLLTSGITVLGKKLVVPKNMVIGRNCRVFNSADLKNVKDNVIYSGSTLK